MRLLKLSIQNFMSIRSAEIRLDNQGLVLLRGVNADSPAFDSNGAGKSSIFEALTYALFEKTLRGLSANEIVNREIGKNTHVYLDFIGDDGKHYRIARYRKHQEHKNNTYIFCEGVNITPKSNKDCNKFIEDLFQMDYLTFTNSVLFGQGLAKMFSVATDAEKKTILEKMLQFDVFSKAQEIAKKRLKDAQNSLFELSSRIEHNERLVSELKEVVADLERAEQDEVKQLKAKIQTLQQELKSAVSELEAFDSDTSEQQKQLNVLASAYESYKQKVMRYKEIEKALSKLESDLYTKERQLNNVADDIRNLEKEKKKVNEGIGSNCPVCGQEVTKSAVQKTIKHIVDKQKQLLDEYKKIQADIKKTQGNIDKVKEFLVNKDADEEKFQKVQEAILSVKATIASKEGARERIERDVKRLKHELEQAEDKLNNNSFKEMREQKINQIKQLEEELKKDKENLEETKALVDRLEFAVEAYGNSGIKSYLLDSVTPFLNERANMYLTKLAGNTVEIEFSTQTRLANGELRDKFEVVIKNNVGGDSYKSNSTGERRRVDLAISLALQDLVMSRSNAKLNILLYDEVFDGLDAVGCENAIMLLQEMAKKVESIFVITHNDILKSYFDRCLVVTKKNGRTTVHTEG